VSRVVLITGGARGIGLACAERFAAQGDRVAVTSGHTDHSPRSPNRRPELFAAVARISNRELEIVLAAAISNSGDATRQGVLGALEAGHDQPTR